MTTTWRKGSNKARITSLLIDHKGLTTHMLGAYYGIRRPQGTLQAMEAVDGVWFDKHTDAGGEVVWRLHGDRVQILPDSMRDLKMFGIEIRCSTQPADTRIRDGLQLALQLNSQPWFNDLSSTKRGALTSDLLDVVRKHLGDRLPQTGAVARAVECGDVHEDPMVDTLFELDIDAADLDYLRED